MREVLRRRQQRAEARIGLERGEVGVGLDLRHVELVRRLRPAEPLERRVGVLLQRVRRADVVEHLRRVGLDLERLAIRGQRLVQLLAALIGDAEQPPRADVGRLARGDGLEDPRRAGRILRLQARRRGGDGRFGGGLRRRGAHQESGDDQRRANADRHEAPRIDGSGTRQPRTIKSLRAADGGVPNDRRNAAVKWLWLE